jgi:hypothetical protein
MSKGDLYSYYWSLINRLMSQNGVPLEVHDKFRQEIHLGLKDYFDVKSISKGKIAHYDLWEYIAKCEMLLKREYMLDANLEEELKL